MMNNGVPRVAIVGAGFGGLNAAQALAHAPVKITVIDTKNFHTFQPLLYEVATAGLSPGESAAPIRSSLRSHRNVEVLMAVETGLHLQPRLEHTPLVDDENAKVIDAYVAHH
jgi:NADH dehydrogenase